MPLRIPLTTKKAIGKSLKGADPLAAAFALSVLFAIIHGIDLLSELKEFKKQKLGEKSNTPLLSSRALA
jgi:hypothetical protein